MAPSDPLTSNPRSQRPIDIVIYAASSFTGRLVLEHLVQTKTSAKWVIGGRSPDKLAKVAAETGSTDIIKNNARDAKDGAKDGIIIADSQDDQALAKLCRLTKIVVTLAGPYNRYGKKLVQHCAAEGTHYLDLTGETDFVAEQIQLHHRRSLDTGAALIFSAGLDSAPPDLATYLNAKALSEKGLKPGKTRSVWKFKGGFFSGGTIATILDATASPLMLLKSFGKPYALSPIQGKHSPSPVLVKREEGQWGGFWLLGPHNGQIVRRTWGLLEATASPQGGSSGSSQSKLFHYGSAFHYDELLRTPDPISSTLLSLIIYITFTFLIALPPLRWLIEWLLPSGSGPSKKTRENSTTGLTTTTHATDGKTIARTSFFAKGDPGYKVTSIMLAEQALALAEDFDRLPGGFARAGGPITPATAFGEVLKERLINVGFKIETELYEKGSRPKKAIKKD